jgi:hypothetical protein
MDDRNGEMSRALADIGGTLRGHEERISDAEAVALRADARADTTNKLLSSLLISIILLLLGLVGTLLASAPLP